MIIYNKSIEKLGREKELDEFQAGIVASRIKEDLQGIDTKKELKKQYTIVFKSLVVVSLFLNLVFLFR